MAEPGVGLQPNVACEFKTGRLSRMTVRGQCSLCKLEGQGLRLVGSDRRLATVGEDQPLTRIFAACESSLSHQPMACHRAARVGRQRGVSCHQLFTGASWLGGLAERSHCSADSEQGARLDPQRGAIAQAIDAKTLCVSHSPSQNQEGIHALIKAGQVTFCKSEQAKRKKTAGRDQRFFETLQEPACLVGFHTHCSRCRLRCRHNLLATTAGAWASTGWGRAATR